MKKDVKFVRNQEKSAKITGNYRKFIGKTVVIPYRKCYNKE